VACEGGVGGVVCGVGGGGLGSASGAASVGAAEPFPARRTQAASWVEAAARSISRAWFERDNARISFDRTCGYVKKTEMEEPADMPFLLAKPAN
jgi:hypothetical protein